jgi:hypothetical protein
MVYEGLPTWVSGIDLGVIAQEVEMEALFQLDDCNNHECTNPNCTCDPCDCTEDNPCSCCISPPE